MSEIFRVPPSGQRQDGDGEEPGLKELLEALDPSSMDSGYWLRFHQTVMRRAAAELARRRAMAELTVTEMVSAWARAVVPTALLAAAAASLMLLDLPGTPVLDGRVEAMLGVEEVLAEGLDGEPIPAVLADESLPGAEGGATFAAEIF